MFDALHILKPGWYFNHPKAGEVWIDYRALDEHDRKSLFPDTGYTSEAGYLADLAYQSLQVQVPEQNSKPLNISYIHPYDEYRFIARFFNKIWLVYFWMNRICRFKNPVTETIGLLRAVKVSRVNRKNGIEEKTTLPAPDNPPLVAVIIPTLNRFDHLENALTDLYNQDYPHIEIIVVDQSDQVPPDFLQKHGERIKYIHLPEKALWLARNTAIEATKAEYLLLFDDDSRVEKTWVSMHLGCLNHFKASVSSGISLSQSGDKIPDNYRFYRLSDQLDTGNALIKREVFRKIGLFDRQFEKQRMGDGEFGLRLFLAGFRNVSNPDAARIHLKVPTGGLRQHGHWDSWRTVSWFSPRPVPSVLYLTRKYWGWRVACRYIQIHILPSVLPYRSKGKRWKLVFYLPFAPLILLALAIQVSRSWIKSGKMLRVGPLIKPLSA